MGNLTIRADDDLIAALEAEADENDRSRAAHVRHVLRARGAPDERVEALESELAECRSRTADLETTIQRLKSEKRTIIAQREEHSQLLAHVEAERAERDRRERRREASVVRRFAWWLTGEPSRGDE